MSTTSRTAHPAIDRYLRELEACVKCLPGVSASAALADAREFLESEWESVRRRPAMCSAEALYGHFSSKFGLPADVAAGYCEEQEPPAASPAPQLWSRSLLLTAMVTPAALLTSLLAVIVAWRATTADASSIVQAGAGAAVRFDLQTMACAGRVVSARRGAPQSAVTFPESVLGMPNCLDTSKQQNTFFSLGRGGELIVEFTDHWLRDGRGADLAIFEVGLAEPVEVAVSEDGKKWNSLGRSTGGIAALDLAAHGLSGKKFRYVRLIDAEEGLADKPAFWGADIDAIVAIHAAPARR